MDRSIVEPLRHDLSRAAAADRHLTERFAAQIEFAEGLARLVGRAGGRWKKLLAEAVEIVTAAVSAGGPGRLAAAVDRAERVLAPIGKVAKQYTVHCVGHGHIDMNWMWSWPETVAVTNDTFTTILKLMDEFPEFCFTQSQASVFAIARDYHPELLAQVQQRVAEGRWEVAAAHWVEGDKNLASGESLARHLLYTRRFVAETFGLAPDDQPLDWEPDTFGHAITIPAIDARGAVRRYYMCRGGAWDKPRVFWYRSPDGSRILVYLDATWYNDQITPAAAQKLLAFCEQTGIQDYMLVYGVGDHGGGPTRRDLRCARDMNTWPIFPSFKFTTTGPYYELLERHADRWPVVDRELNFEFTGCYTSQSLIKRNNRFGENAMAEAETAAALAWRALGRAYPTDAIRAHWVHVLFGHFHDILPGSGWPQTRRYSDGMFQRVAAAASQITTQSLRALAAEVGTSFAGAIEASELPSECEPIALGAGAGRGTLTGGLSSAAHVAAGPRPFVVFNPTAAPRAGVVQATVWDTADEASDPKNREFLVRTSDGRTMPAQKLASGHYWGHDYVDLAVPVSVGSLGHAAFAIDDGAAADHAPGVTCTDDPPRHLSYGDRNPVLENAHLRMRFDALTGGVTELIDKASGRDLADPARPLGVLEYVRERPGGMSAWTIHSLAECRCPLPLDTWECRSSGPHVAAMRARLRIADSSASVTYTLRADEPWMEITIETRWVERGGPQVGIPGLRMRFPLALTQATGRYEVPFGAIGRDLSGGEEVPSLRWADVTGPAADGKRAGCAVLNDCKYGHSLDGSTLRVNLLRSSYEPDPLPEIGDHTIRLAVVPHGKRLPDAELIRLGAAFNHPLHVVSTDVHEGRLPPADEALTCTPASVVVSSVKKAEDDDALIVRLYETAGKATVARVTLDKGLLGEVGEATEVDLLERPVKPSGATATASGFTVKLDAYAIASVKVLAG